MKWSLCLTAGLCAIGLARSEEPNRLITTSATATVRYQPDAVRIQFRLRNIETTQDEARKASVKAFKELDDKLAALKLKDMKMSVSPLSSSLSTTRSARGFNPGGGGANPGAVVEPRNTYAAMQTISLLIREKELDKLTEAVEKVEKLLVDTGVPTTATIVDDDLGTRTLSSGVNVTMFRQDDAAFREQALTEAVQKAIKNAKALAKGAGVEIKEIASITDLEVGTAAESSTPPARTTARGGPGGFSGGVASSTLAPSYHHDLEITVRVIVKCKY
jgi:uncharacterized protein YggE